MKKQYLLLLLVFLGIKLNAQICNFTYTLNPGTTLVNFSPDPLYSPNLYHFVWAFGDGTTSTQVFPTHAYNSVFPLIACYDIYDTSNNLVCSACDSIRFTSAGNCFFTYQNVSGNTFTFQSQGVPGGVITWTFGDGTSGTGDPVTHTFAQAGQYTVVMFLTDSLTGVTICQNGQGVIVGSVSTNCSFVATSLPGVPPTFNFGAIVTAGSSVTWDFGDGANDTGLQVTHTYNSPNVYLVCISVIEPNGLACTYCQPVQAGNVSNCIFSYVADPSVTNGFIFTASSTNPTSTYGWDFGDGSTGIGTTISHSYASPGTYTVCVYERDSIGSLVCSSCVNVVVYNGSNNCFFTFAPAPNVLNGYTFAGSPAYGTSNLVWDFGDGSTGTGTTISHSYSLPGAYTVCMYEMDSLGYIRCTSCNTVYVSNTVSCSFISNVNSISPLTIDFTVISGAGNFISWDFGDGTNDTGVSVQHTYAAPGVYQVCILVGTPGTLTCTYCDVISVGAPVQCAITFYPDPFNPNTFVFNSSVGPGNSSVQWTFGDGSAGTGQSVTHTYNAAGTYVVCITEWDFLQQVVCHSCTTITVNSGGPANCQAAFLGVASGLNAYFIDMSIVNSNNVTYTWDFGDNTSSTIQFPQHTYLLPGAYNVCLTINTGTCNDTYCSNIIVDTLVQNPSNGCNAFFAIVQLAPYQVSVVNLSSGLNISFDWDYGDGSPHDTNPYPSHYYSSTGLYNLCLTVADPNGCTSSYCDTLHVDTLGNIYRTSTPGFTINVVSPMQMTSGVSEVKKVNTFRAFPNPVTSELHISMINGLDKAKGFRILSYQGAEILSGNLNGTEGKINTQSLASGAYLLEVTLIDGSRSYQSVIKE